MEKRILKILAGCVVLGILVFASCRKVDSFDNLQVVNYDAEFAIPLFHAKTSFQDILEQFDEDTYVQIGPDDLITVFYKGDVAGRSSSDILDTMNAYTNGTLPIFIADSTYLAYPLDFTQSINVDIDYAILKNTTLDYGHLQIDTLPPEELTIKFWIPNLTKDGQQFEFSYTSGGNRIPGAFPSFDLDGYKLSPENDTITAFYEALRPDSSSVILQSFIALINDLEFNYVEGYLGNDVFELERDTIVIDFFENWTRGDVYFADPKINMIIKNSFGFPVQSEAKAVYVFNVDGGIDSLESVFLDSIIVDYPELSEVGETKYTYFDFNKDNSNIDVILGNGPVAIDYDFNALSNPENDTAIRGFMTDSSEMSVQLEVELPMYGTASGFEARDTFGINFDSYENFDDVEFKIISENGIPLDVGMQIYFADKDGIVLDSLFTPFGDILQGAPVDAEGLPTNIAEKTTFTTFEGERFDNIKKAKHLFLHTSFSTVNNGETMVKILSAQEVKIRMGMKIGLSG